MKQAHNFLKLLDMCEDRDVESSASYSCFKTFKGEEDSLLLKHFCKIV